MILRSINQFDIDLYPIWMHSKGAKVNINSNFSIYHSKSLNRDTHINAQYKMIK